MDEDRVKHAIAVARKMIQIAKDIGLSENEINDCFIIGYNHDIGYEFAENIIEHNKIGGNILKECGFKYWKEIFYHGEIECNYKSLYLNILNQADMQAMSHIPMTMEDWKERLNGFLTLWDHDVLKDNGKISAEMAKIYAETEFEKYRIVQDKIYVSDFDELLLKSKNIKDEK